MDPDCRTCRILRRYTLSKEACNKSCKDIAGTAFCKAAVLDFIDKKPAVGKRNERLAVLEDDNALKFCRELQSRLIGSIPGADPFNACGDPCKLAHMGSKDRRCSPVP